MFSLIIGDQWNTINKYIMKILGGSVSDTYSSLTNVSNSLTWEKVYSSFKLNQFEIICEGLLQELSSNGYQKPNIMYYSATIYKLYCYKV